MAREEAVYCVECDIVRLRYEQKQLQSALKLLFELLEEYAPSWYKEEHHDIAIASFSGFDESGRE